MGLALIKIANRLKACAESMADACPLYPSLAALMEGFGGAGIESTATALFGVECSTT